MKRILLKYGLTAFFAVFFTLPILAQDDPGTGGTGDEDPDPAPIDNWALLLILAGVAVGAYFIINQRRKSIA